MKSICVVILFICMFSLTGISQTASLDTIPSATNPVSNSGSKPQKLHLNVTAGTSFWSASGWGSGFDSYVMTGLSYPLGKKFSIEGGIGIVNSTFTAKKQGLSEYSWYGNQNQTHTLVYVTGNYLLNEHLTVSGTLYKDFSTFNATAGYPGYKPENPQGLYMNVKYKVNDFLQIEAGFGYSKGYNLYDPYRTGYHGYGGSLWDH